MFNNVTALVFPAAVVNFNEETKRGLRHMHSTGYNKVITFSQRSIFYVTLNRLLLIISIGMNHH